MYSWLNSSGGPHHLCMRPPSAGLARWHVGEMPPRICQTCMQRKPNRSAKWNMLLKDMNVSFQINPQTLRTPKIWARTNLGNMQPSFCTATPLPPRIGEWKRSRSARWRMFLKATMISFRTSHWTWKTAQNWARNIPTTCAPPPHPHALLTSDWRTKTRSIGETKHVPETYDGQLSNEPLNIKSAQKLGKERTNTSNLPPTPPMALLISNWRMKAASIG